MAFRTDVVELREYEASEPIRLDERALALLSSLPSERIAVQTTSRTEWYRLRATSWVGAVSLPGLTIRIRPKVEDLQNVLMLFGASAGLTEWTGDDIDYARAELVDGVAALVFRAVDAATRQGLVHGYQNREERLPVIRGRLLVEGLSSRPWDIWPAPCRYDEFTVDVPENRVLLATVSRLRRWAIQPQERRHGRELLQRLAGVADSPFPLWESDMVRRTRLNEHYTSALALCRLVLDGLGVAHAAGDQEGHSFLIDMNKLFERWVGAELTQRLWPDIEVMEQESVPLSKHPRVNMAPDLIFKRAGKTAFVGDVKYKLTSSGLSRTDDYYQLLAYATALRLDRGVLIYCQADEAPAREITVDGGGQRLLCHPLSLAGSWTGVSTALDELAEVIRSAATLSVAASS